MWINILEGQFILGLGLFHHNSVLLTNFSEYFDFK